VTEFVRAKQHGSEQRRIAEEMKSRAIAMEAEVYRRAQQIQEANAQLREFQAELESRVLERTAELQHANDDLRREIAERQRAEEALRKSEDQLRHSQKMDAIGRLAGGVAHDFNNLLTVILSYSDLLLARTDAGSEARTGLTEIQRAGRRAAELTRHLLAFSRRQVLDPAILDLNEILKSLNAMLPRLLRESVELTFSLAPDLGRIRADRGQVEQVVMNLVVNARDAMPEGGKLLMETANVDLDADYAAGHLGVLPGPYVLLAVSDTGIGMDRATQARAFEPFFTTKEQGKGTGLGLSTVFGIVQQSGGAIWLYSEPGQGATFKIYLPRVEGAVRPLVLPETTAARPRGTETILLLEDEEQVRAIARSILADAGYHVLVAATPAEALLVSERHPTRIDLLLTDLVMPKMNGKQVSEKIRFLRPGIRVLFMSGYTDDVILHHGVLEAGVAFLQKPLTPDALTRKVRQVLDAVLSG
jgi:signal transduction histidine kinase/ActR/RegA family two-component response regulator